MDVLLALKDAIESDVRIDAQEEAQVGRFPGRRRARTSTTAGSRKTCTRRCSCRSSRRRRSCSTSTSTRSRRRSTTAQIKDPITNEERKPDERFLRSVEEKIHISESGKQSFRQEVVRKAMGAYKRGDKFTLDSHAPLHDAVEQYLFEQRRDVLRLVSSADAARRRDAHRRSRWSRSAWSTNTATTAHSAREALNYVTTLLAQE